MKVIIVGAGISGLTLAAALAQLAPRVEVDLYERDTAADARRKGYANPTKQVREGNVWPLGDAAHP